MKISKIKIQNFRGYHQETIMDINNLTVFVGKNDVGKSTVLEVLDIFFNEGKGVVKIDKEDINKQGAANGNKDIVISVIFEDLPEKLVIDSTNSTVLADEYLLNNDGKLEVVKRYPNAAGEKVLIKANHPTNADCANLLLKKQNDLKGIIERTNIPCTDKAKNAVMRKAIWEHYSSDLKLQEIEIDVTKEDAKNIWKKLKEYMPLYSLFQSDRKNSDGDSEIQDPMKLAVKEIFRDSDIQTTLDEIATKVDDELKLVADRTLEKLKEMNPEIASSLKPVIPSPESLKWADIFKNVSISGDGDIPINKRGSGVKRLVLLSFFRAEAERRKAENSVPNIIYAIEEPETSQHPEYQNKLIEAFIELSKSTHTQIILTTHSPSIVKMLNFENLKLIKGTDSKEVISIKENNLPYPSLNEVNFLAFGESDEGYHSELYGFIESEGWLSDFETEKQTRQYTRIKSDGQTCRKGIVLSKYIRNQIHHPENKHNPKFRNDELQESINEMRNYIKDEKK